MTTENSTGFQTFQATATAIAESVRVKVDSNGLISAAGATDDFIGVTRHPIAASGYGEVKLKSAPGTFLVTASAAVSRGAKLYNTASGKVDDASAGGSFSGLVALEAATADGDIIEAALVNNSGAGKMFVPFFINLATLADGDVLTTFTPGFSGKITSVDFRVHAAATTGSKAATLNLEIGTTNLTGGVVALTSANCTPAGAAVAGSAVTAANVFGPTDTISIEASSVTAFVEGTGWLILGLQNLEN